MRSGGVMLAALLALCLGLSCVSKPTPRKAANADPAKATKDVPPPVSDPAFTEYWQNRATEAHARAPGALQREGPLLPDDPAATAPAPLSLEPLPERPLPKQAITLVMRDAPVREVLQALARSANLNLLVGAKVVGTVSVELRDSAWDEAFTGLLQNLGLHHSWSGDILRVVTVEEMQEALKIETAEKDRLALEHQKVQTEALILDTIALHYADATKLQTVLATVLTKSGVTYAAAGEAPRELPRGEVVADAENNTIIVHAVRSDVEKIRRLVETLDCSRQQVLIEARIVLANRQTARQLGVQWGALYANGRSFFYPGANSTGVTGTTIDKAINPTNAFTGNFPSGGATSSTTGTGTGTGTGTSTGTSTGTGTTAATTAAAASGLQFGYGYQALGSLLLTTQLSALETAGKAQVIATPSITTIENQEAVLKSGYEIPYTSYSADQGNEIEFKEVLLELKVKPHVIAGGMVRMSITASNDEPDYSRVDSGITKEPAITTRSAQTNGVLYSGETTVIGGLSKSYGSDAREGIPWLMDIPWIGALFRSKSKMERHEEMLIFITPYILDKAGALTSAPALPPAAGEPPVAPAPPSQEPGP